jgi:hypothetical protein
VTFQVSSNRPKGIQLPLAGVPTFCFDHCLVQRQESFDLREIEKLIVFFFSNAGDRQDRLRVSGRASLMFLLLCGQG